MGKILDAFAMDNLSTEPAIYQGSPEYEKARKRFCDLGEQLLARLNQEEKTLLEEYTSAQSEENSLYAVERFVRGYRLGVLMTMEVFAGGSDLLP